MGEDVSAVLNSGRRDKVEIMSAIIVMTEKPSILTHIMHHVNLSYPSLKKYIQLLISLRLIEKRELPMDAEKNSYVYQATERGLDFLKVYCELLRLMHGDNFLANGNNLAVACLQYCREVEKRPRSSVRNKRK